MAHTATENSVLYFSTFGTDKVSDSKGYNVPAKVADDPNNILYFRIGARFRNRFGKTYEVAFTILTHTPKKGDEFVTCYCDYARDIDAENEHDLLAKNYEKRLEKLRRAWDEKNRFFHFKTDKEKEEILAWMKKAEKVKDDLQRVVWQHPTIDACGLKYSSSEKINMGGLIVPTDNVFPYTKSAILRIINSFFYCRYYKIEIEPHSNICDRESTCEFLPDTPLADIAKLQPRQIEGLFFVDNNFKVRVPARVYFGCGNFEVGGDEGMAWCHYNSALHPVWQRCKDGKSSRRLRDTSLRNVLADYDGKTLHNWRRE